jgi:hypothetical protein
MKKGGKAKKMVAGVACMRKMLLPLNAILRNGEINFQVLRNNRQQGEIMFIF